MKTNIDIKHRIQEAFNHAAETYDSVALVQQKACHHLMDLMIPSVPTSGVFLDLGCGTGQLSGLIRNKLPGASVMGIDIANMMVKKAKCENDLSVCADMDALCVQNGSIDVIASNLTFQWALDLRHTLDQCRFSNSS